MDGTYAVVYRRMEALKGAIDACEAVLDNTKPPNATAHAYRGEMDAIKFTYDQVLRSITKMEVTA